MARMQIAHRRDQPNGLGRPAAPRRPHLVNRLDHPHDASRPPRTEKHRSLPRIVPLMAGNLGHKWPFRHKAANRAASGSPDGLSSPLASTPAIYGRESMSVRRLGLRGLIEALVEVVVARVNLSPPNLQRWRQ